MVYAIYSNNIWTQLHMFKILITLHCFVQSCSIWHLLLFSNMHYDFICRKINFCWSNHLIWYICQYFDFIHNIWIMSLDWKCAIIISLVTFSWATYFGVFGKTVNLFAKSFFSKIHKMSFRKKINRDLSDFPKKVINRPALMYIVAQSPDHGYWNYSLQLGNTYS